MRVLTLLFYAAAILLLEAIARSLGQVADWVTGGAVLLALVFAGAAAVALFDPGRFEA